MKTILIILLAISLTTLNASAQIINTIAGTGPTGWGSGGYNGDGIAADTARLSYPRGLALDKAGNVYIADAGNYRIRKIDTNTGIITTIAGPGTTGVLGDGGPATSANLSSPLGVALDTSGNIYIAEGNRIRKVNAVTGIISTIAGSGTTGFGGDGGPATVAQLNSPEAIALDDSGNVYIADTDNHRIRKITVSTGIINTIAGDGTVGCSGNGGAATSAQLAVPVGLTVDKVGNIFIADHGCERVRKIDASTGIISTIAGTGGTGFSGDGGTAISAEIDPYGITLDTAGNLYITNYLPARIRKIDSTGIISSIAGGGLSGLGDGGPATASQLSYPTGVALDALQNVYIVDWYNHRIRKITMGITTDINIKQSEDKVITVFPNPNNGQFNFRSLEKESTIEIYDLTGRLVYQMISKNDIQTIDLGNMDKGVYIYKIKNVGILFQQGKIVLQ